MDTQETGAEIEEVLTENSSQADVSTEEAEQAEQKEEHSDTSDVDILKKRLSDKDSHISKLENELRKKEPQKKKPAEDEIDWKIENAPRIRVVKDSYLKHLEDLKGLGAKETNELREKALQLAENETGVRDSSEAERQAANSSAPGITSRSSKPPVVYTEAHKRLGIPPERVQELEEKYPELKKGF